MGHAGSGRGSRQCGASRVGKKIQHFHRPSRHTDLFREPVPVSRLLRKKPCMLKAERLQMKRQLFSGRKPVSDTPLLGQSEKFPFASAFGASVIVTAVLFPSVMFLRRIPDHLRIRTDQKIVSPALQFFFAGGVDHLVVFPVICYEHMSGSLSLHIFLYNAKIYFSDLFNKYIVQNRMCQPSDWQEQK